MPITWQDTPQPNTLLALWQIEEGVQALEARCTQAEVNHARQFTGEARQREWLAWHALLHALAPGVEVGYNEVGAPVLKNSSGASVLGSGVQDALPGEASPWRHISVSHTRAMVAVLLSDCPCGIDIESIDRNFAKAAPRYLHETEHALTLPAEFPAAALSCVVWCSKEALYKWSGAQNVDFRREIRMQNTGQSAILQGSIRGQNAPVHLLLHDNTCVVYCTK